MRDHTQLRAFASADEVRFSPVAKQGMRLGAR